MTGYIPVCPLGAVIFQICVALFVMKDVNDIYEYTNM